MRVLVLGAGGHAQVVVDILRCAHQAGDAVVPIAYLDDDRFLCGQILSGLPVLGSLEEVGNVSHDAVLLAIGDNCTRQRLYEKLLQRGERFVTAIHPRSVVAAGVTIGPDSVVGAGVVVNVGSRIGQNVILNTGCTIDHGNHIGDHCHIAPGAHLGGDVKVGASALVGIGAVVLPQHRIGEGATVGAGAVVTEDIPPHTTWVGIPARRVSECTQDQQLVRTSPRWEPSCAELFPAEFRKQKSRENK
jgi:sugar O-acyltransferase (sialic acid O-acetyltransferase NeuD family)